MDAFWVFDGAGKRVPPQASRVYVESCRMTHSPVQDSLVLTQQTRSSFMMPGNVRCDWPRDNTDVARQAAAGPGAVKRIVGKFSCFSRVQQTASQSHKVPLQAGELRG